jgi:hypothetical protein
VNKIKSYRRIGNLEMIGFSYFLTGLAGALPAGFAGAFATGF